MGAETEKVSVSSEEGVFQTEGTAAAKARRWVQMWCV